MTTATEMSTQPERLRVNKTYKLYIGGKFPRTESGRHYQIQSGENVCQGSRKDIREAVVAARAAFPGWASKTAYNRGQILYRIAEMLEDRASQFEQELLKSGSTGEKAKAETHAAIDRLVFYAGFADKYQSILSSVNPVSASYFNFSIAEPMGIIGVLSGEEAPLLSLVSTLAPVIASGNTCVLVPSKNAPTPCMSFAEVLATSDVPGGVINFVTGDRAELMPHLASHMDVNAVLCCNPKGEEKKLVQEQAIGNLKRTVFKSQSSWQESSSQGLQWIGDFCETKTTWHPIGK